MADTKTNKKKKSVKKDAVKAAKSKSLKETEDEYQRVNKDDTIRIVREEKISVDELGDGIDLEDVKELDKVVEDAAPQSISKEQKFIDKVEELSHDVDGPVTQDDSWSEVENMEPSGDELDRLVDQHTISPNEIFAEVEDLLVTEPEPQTEKVEQHSLVPEDGALHGASRNVVTASHTLKKVSNRPRVFNSGGVPTTVKSVVESNRTGFFRIHRDRDIKN